MKLTICQVKTEMTDKTMTILKEHLSNIKNQKTAPLPSEGLSEAIQIEILPDRVTVISVNKVRFLHIYLRSIISCSYLLL